MDPSYNNLGGFGSGGTVSPASAPISSGTGDIILAPEKKSHKKGIVLVLILVVLTIGGIFAVMFLMSKKGGGANVGDEARLAFNKYANYLLYGEDSDKALEGEYKKEREEKLYVMLDAESRQAKSYANSLNTLWNDFVNSTVNFSFGDGIMRDDYGERVKFITTYIANSSKVNEETIMELEQADAEKVVNDYFGLYQQFGFEEAEEYVENGRLYFDNLVRILGVIKESECDIDNENMNSEIECSEESIFGNDEEYKNLDTYYSDMSMAIYDTADYLIENGWKINARLNGGSE